MSRKIRKLYQKLDDKLVDQHAIIEYVGLHADGLNRGQQDQLQREFDCIWDSINKILSKIEHLSLKQDKKSRKAAERRKKREERA